MLGRLSKTILDLHRASREYSVEAFQDAAFALVGSVIPFDSAGWMTGRLTPDRSDTIFNTLHLYRQPLQLISDWRQVKDNKTVFFQRVFESAGTTLPCVVAQEMGPELAAHCKRYGVEHILATANIDPITALNETISLWRAEPDAAFTESERQFQQALVPHLVDTWRINRMLHLSRASQSPCVSTYHAAAIDGEGFLHVVEPGFTQLLLKEWPDWSGPRLPAQLAAVIAGSDEFIGNQVVIERSRFNDQILLRGRNKSAIDNLGPRKREVAKYFAAGYTHKEIAQALNLSPATVRNYLSAIYSALNISSKAELANLLRG